MRPASPHTRCLIAALLLACFWTTPAHADDDRAVRAHFDKVEVLRVQKRAAVANACERIRAENEELISESDELAEAHGEWMDPTYKDGKMTAKRVRVFDKGKQMSDKTIEAPSC